jgi:hypothetical protein
MILHLISSSIFVCIPVSLGLIELGVRWEVYVARMGKINTCTLLVKKRTKGKN